MDVPSGGRGSSNFAPDPSLRRYLETNADIVTRITKPVRMDDIGALSAQSDQPILFENIVEKPGFRLCDILVKNRRSQARPSASRRRISSRRLLIASGSRRANSRTSNPVRSKK
jgi:hypothetical protein